MGFARNHYSTLLKLKDKYDTWLSYSESLLEDDPDALIKDSSHVQETGDVLISLCKQVASLCYSDPDHIMRQACVAVPQLTRSYVQKLDNIQLTTGGARFHPNTPVVFEKVVAGMARAYFFEEVQEHA